jgi:hypothetical protein
MSPRSRLPSTDMLFADTSLSLVPVILHWHRSAAASWVLTCGTLCVRSALSGVAGGDVLSALRRPERRGEGISLQLGLINLFSGDVCAVMVGVIVGVIVDWLTWALLPASAPVLPVIIGLFLSAALSCPCG